MAFLKLATSKQMWTVLSSMAPSQIVSADRISFYACLPIWNPKHIGCKFRSSWVVAELPLHLSEYAFRQPLRYPRYMDDRGYGRAKGTRVIKLTGHAVNTTDSKRESSVGVHGHVHQAVPSIAVCDTGGIGVTMWPGRARRPGAQ